MASTESTARAYQQVSDQQRRDQLIIEHLDYVAHVLSPLLVRLPEHVDGENLRASGVLGLIEAARSFDPERGIPFKTFCYPRIRGAIIDELRRNSPLSQQRMKLVQTVRDAAEQLEPPATAEAISRLTGLSVEEVEMGFEAMRLHPQQWDARVVERATSAWSRETPASRIDREEQKAQLVEAIERLPERERMVVTLYYLEELRLKEIGEVLDLSESRVSRLLARAEWKLKHYCQSET